MDSTATVEYQSNQVTLFMAGITKDLDEHAQAQSRKYAFDFQQEKPIHVTDSDFRWDELSHISKSKAAGKQPRMHVTYGRESTAMTLHSVQADPLSSRSNVRSTAFSPERAQPPDAHMIGRQSSLFHASPFQTDQTRLSLRASQVNPSSYRFQQQHLAGSEVCIPEEECESQTSPDQSIQRAYFTRESLAERPELEGSIQSPDRLPMSTPFSAQNSAAANRRQIPVWQPHQRPAAACLIMVGDTTAQGAGGMAVMLPNQPERMDTEAEMEELDSLADMDGPSDTAGLKVYATEQPFTNLETLDRSGNGPSLAGIAKGAKNGPQLD